MTPESTSHADSRNEEFVRLIGAHQGRIYGFVFTLVPRRSEAEELVQQISVVLWRKFDSFQRDGGDIDSAFVSWACGVAYYEVLHYLRSLKREQHALSTAALERLRDARLRRTDVFDQRRDALTVCLERLVSKDRTVIDAYYFEGVQDVKQIAAATGRSVDAIYKSLQRIRSALHECIESRLAGEES